MKDTKTKKRSFFTDIWRKVIALFLAIFAWYAIHKQLVEGLPVISMKVPLQIECADKQVILPENTMEITLKIKNSILLNKLSPDDFEVKYVVTENVNTIPDGGMTVFLNRGKDYKIKKPPFTTNVGFDINTSFFLDKMSVKTVPVEVKYKGILPYGKVPQFNVTPEYVQIKGPSSVLVNIHKAFTDEIDISNIKNDKHFECQLQDLPEKVRLNESKDTPITVLAKAMNARDIQAYKLVASLPLLILHPYPQRSRLLEDKTLAVSLTFETDAETFSEIKKLKMKPYLDLSSISAVNGEVELPVMLDLPRGVSERIYHVIKEPDVFKVKLRPVDEKGAKEDSGNEK